MNCKFCDAQLEEGVTLCPACGKENAEELLEEVIPAEEVSLFIAIYFNRLSSVLIFLSLNFN